MIINADAEWKTWRFTRQCIWHRSVCIGCWERARTFVSRCVRYALPNVPDNISSETDLPADHPYRRPIADREHRNECPAWRPDDHRRCLIPILASTFF